VTVRWIGHVACVETMRNANKSFVKKPKGGYHATDLPVDVGIILKRND
jgi:hypothetical protein